MVTRVCTPSKPLRGIGLRMSWGAVLAWSLLLVTIQSSEAARAAAPSSSGSTSKLGSLPENP